MGPLVRTLLLESDYRSEDDAKPYDYHVTVADGVAVLLENGSWVALVAPVRQELTSDPLALALYAQFESNEKGYPTYAETIKGQTGRAEVVRTPGETVPEKVKKKPGMQTGKWLSALRRALAMIEAATGWPQCELATEGASAGMVVVRKRNTRRRPQPKTL